MSMMECICQIAMLHILSIDHESCYENTRWYVNVIFLSQNKSFGNKDKNDREFKSDIVNHMQVNYVVKPATVVKNMNEKVLENSTASSTVTKHLIENKHFKN